MFGSTQRTTYDEDWQKRGYSREHLSMPGHCYDRNEFGFSTGSISSSASSASSSWQGSLNYIPYFPHHTEVLQYCTNVPQYYTEILDYQMVPPQFIDYRPISQTSSSASSSVDSINSFNSVRQEFLDSAKKPFKYDKKKFYIGMKPQERLNWIREAFPKEEPITPTWKSAAPVKPLRRPHT